PGVSSRSLLSEVDVWPSVLPLHVAPHVLRSRLVPVELARPPHEVEGPLLDRERPLHAGLTVARQTEDREPVGDRPVDLSVPELLLGLRRRPAEEFANSLPGETERGDHAGDAD